MNFVHTCYDLCTQYTLKPDITCRELRDLTERPRNANKRTCSTCRNVCAAFGPTGAVNRVFDGIEDVAVWAMEALLTMVRPLIAAMKMQ